MELKNTWPRWSHILTRRNEILCSWSHLNFLYKRTLEYELFRNCIHQLREHLIRSIMTISEWKVLFEVRKIKGIVIFDDWCENWTVRRELLIIKLFKKIIIIHKYLPELLKFWILLCMLKDHIICAYNNLIEMALSPQFLNFRRVF